MNNNSETEDESTSTADAYEEDDLQWCTHSVDANNENLLDRVYEAVRDGQSPYDLQGDEWRLDHMGIW